MNWTICRQNVVVLSSPIDVRRRITTCKARHLHVITFDGNNWPGVKNCQFHQCVYAQLLHAQLLHVQIPKLQKNCLTWLSSCTFGICAHKMLLKLIAGVNFANIFWASFSNKSVFPSFSVLTVWVCNFWHMEISAKAACKIFVKLTAVENFLDLLLFSIF